MSCPTCLGVTEESSNCVLKALSTIKGHFLMMQNLCTDNVNIIKLLRQRNDKLHNALELLTQQQRKQQNSYSPKRRKLSPKKSQQQQQENKSRNRSNVIVETAGHSPLPESQNSLNMNIALQPDDEDETITETEPALSPCKPYGTRRKYNNFNVENQRPNCTKTSETKAEWLGKTKMSLTLRNKSPRLKQSCLQFNASNVSSDKEVIDSSPNLYSSLKKAKQSRSYLHRTTNNNVLSDNSSIASGDSKSIKNNQSPVFDFDEDDSFFELCPDPSVPKPSKPDDLPRLSGLSDTSSVLMLPPPTQEIVFVDDSIDESRPPPLNTMAFMEEAIKDDDKVSLTRLQAFEAKLIQEQKQVAGKIKDKDKSIKVKMEVLTEQPSGNDSTKLPDDFDMEEIDAAEEDKAAKQPAKEADEEDEIFPRPIVIKEEAELDSNQRYDIDCKDCKKFIDFMGPSLTDEKIREYLYNCKHYDYRDMNNTPDGFWNPLMVTFAEDDPRSKVHVEPPRKERQRKK